MDPVIDRQCGYLVLYEQRPIGRMGELDIRVEPESQRSLLGLWAVAKSAKIGFDLLHLRTACGSIFANHTPSARCCARLPAQEATVKPGRRPASGDEGVLIVSFTVEHDRLLCSRSRWDDVITGRGTRP